MPRLKLHSYRQHHQQREHKTLIFKIVSIRTLKQPWREAYAISLPYTKACLFLSTVLEQSFGGPLQTTLPRPILRPLSHLRKTNSLVGMPNLS